MFYTSKHTNLLSHKFHAILTPVFTALSTSLFSTISIKAFTIARTTAVHERGCPQHLRPQKHSCNSSAPVFHPRRKPPSTCQLKPKSTPVSCSKANPYLHPPAQTRGAPSLPPQTKTSHIPASSSPSHAQYPIKPKPHIYQPACDILVGIARSPQILDFFRFIEERAL